MKLNVAPKSARRTARKDEPKQNRRPKMTAEDATAFVGFSNSSAAQVIEAIEARTAEGIHASCTCEPYTDTFTFNRWKALGFSVQKGEKALRIATFAECGAGKSADVPGAEETEGDAKKARLRPVTAFLFCRCQVCPTKGAEA
jgi:hypothetical protein